MKGWSESSWRQRLKLICFGLIPVVCLLAVAQSCAYMTIHRTVAMQTDSVTGLTYYSMQIGRWPWSYRSLTPINSLGLPDREFVAAAPKGACTHVLLAGDSFTFGDAISASARWSSLLEGMTARRISNKCIRFFNIGVRNTTIDTTIARIRQVLPLIDPDVVILGQYQNDLTDLANPGSPAWVPAGEGRAHDSHWGTRLGRIVPGYNVSLLRLVTYRTFAFMIEHEMEYDVLGTWSVLEGESKRPLAEKLKTIYHDLYAELVTEMEAREIEFGVLIFPSKMDLLAKRAPEGEYFAELAREFEVPSLSLMPVLDAHREPMPYHVYDGHLSEAGNRVVAEAVWNWLFTSTPAPIASLGGLAGTSATSTASAGR